MIARQRAANLKRATVRAGVATVELALALPLLLLFCAIAVDFARVYVYQQVLADCARNGAMYQSDVTLMQASPYDSISEAAQADSGALRGDMRVEATFLPSAQKQDFIEVTTRYTFHRMVRLPGLPTESELVRKVRMRLPRSAQTDDASTP